jgi:hypothetical protein
MDQLRWHLKGNKGTCKEKIAKEEHYDVINLVTTALKVDISAFVTI